jgi:hypothetical protein
MFFFDNEKRNNKEMTAAEVACRVHSKEML